MLTAFIHLGSMCNLNCPHCADKHFVGDVHEPWQIDLLEQSIEVLRCALGVDVIALTGGEPTTLSDFDRIVRFASGAGLRIDLFTNAVWPKNMSVSHLLRLGVSRLVVSLDSLNALPAHGRNTMATAPLDLIAEAASLLRVAIVTTVSKVNIKALDKIMEFCGGIRVEHILVPIDVPSQLSHLSLNSLDKEEKELLLRALASWAKNDRNRFRAKLFLSMIDGTELPNVRCDWGSKMIALFPNGNLYPCLFARHQKSGVSLLDLPEDELKLTVLNWGRARYIANGCKRTICFSCLSNGVGE